MLGALLVVGMGARAAARAEPSAPGESIKTVLLVRSPGDEAVVVRLRAEFEALGWRLLEQGQREPLDYEAWIRQADANAALRVLSRNAVDLWFLDAQTGELVLDRLTLGGRPAEGVVALRAIETLRARLIPGGVTREAPRQVEASEGEALEDAETESRLFVGLGPALSYGPGGVGALGHGALFLRYRFPGRFAGVLFAWGPLVSRELDVPEGVFDLRGAFFGGSLEWIMSDGDFGTALGVGLASAVLDVTGHAEPPYQGVPATAVTTLPMVTLSGSYRWLSASRLRTDLFAGYALPTASVRVLKNDSEEAEAAAWGAPLFGGLVGIDVGM